jgi:hypothetical protein
MSLSDARMNKDGKVGLSLREQIIFLTDHNRNYSFSCISTINSSKQTVAEGMSIL